MESKTEYEMESITVTHQLSLLHNKIDELFQTLNPPQDAESPGVKEEEPSGLVSSIDAISRSLEKACRRLDQIHSNVLEAVKRIGK